MSDLPPRVRIELPTWLTLVIIGLVLVLVAFGVESILDNASDAQQMIEDQY